MSNFDKYLFTQPVDTIGNILSHNDYRDYLLRVQNAKGLTPGFNWRYYATNNYPHTHPDAMQVRSEQVVVPNIIKFDEEIYSNRVY